VALYGQGHIDRYVATDGREGHALIYEEKQELWPIMTREWPAYDRYQEGTDREIPLVILEPH
jgi:F420H(2)-dependent quinone reductase